MKAIIIIIYDGLRLTSNTVDLFFIKQIFRASVANMCSVQFLADLSNFSEIGLLI